MSILGNSAGIFRIDESDEKPGSFFLEEEAAAVFGVDEIAFANVPKSLVDDQVVLDERELQKAWYSNSIPGAPAVKIRNASRSFDELVLMEIMRRAIPGVQIESQVQWGRRSLDLRVTTPEGVSKIIEFHGPSHFAPSRYGAPTEAPSIRRREIEDAFGVECVVWPYWIQRSAANVRAIFDPEVQGLGLLWSTNVHFGSFVFADSAQIILELSERFKAVRSEGVGYFYGPSTENRKNPEHPLISSIANGGKSKNLLIPQGAEEENFWLPSRLHELPE